MGGHVSSLMEEENKGDNGFWEIIIPESRIEDLKVALMDLFTWKPKQESILVLEEFSLFREGFITDTHFLVIKEEQLDEELTIIDSFTQSDFDEEGLLNTNLHNEEDKKQTNVNTLDNILSQSKHPTLKCDYTECKEKKFKSRKLLHIHMQITHEHICSDICGFSKEKSSKRKVHEKIPEKSVQYFCEECGNKFSNGQNLKQHKESVHENRSVPCPECGKIFKHANNLRIHRDQKHSNQLFLCNYCATEFSSKKNLARTLNSIKNLFMKIGLFHVQIVGRFLNMQTISGFIEIKNIRISYFCAIIAPQSFQAKRI